MSNKPLVWLGSSLEDLRGFPPEARRAAGYELRRLQSGLMPSDWKPLATVAPGVQEIRIHTGLEHRVVYIAKLPEAIYVLHAFEKQTRQTRQADLALARRRFADCQALRRKGREL